MYSFFANRTHAHHDGNGRSKPKPPKRLLNGAQKQRNSGTSLRSVWASMEPCRKKRNRSASKAQASAGHPDFAPTSRKPKKMQPLAPIMSDAAMGARQLCKDYAAPPPQSLDTGSVFESDLEHLQRHRKSGQAGSCLRCQFLCSPRALQRAASLPCKAGGFATWLEPRPAHEGGSWALGCRICAWYQHAHGGKGQPLAASGGGAQRKHKRKLVKDPMMRKRPQPRFSKFANFTFRLFDKRTLEQIRQHGRSSGHERAHNALLQKESGCELRVVPEAARFPGPGVIFKGRVPKPKDWLDCFVETSLDIAWKKQAKVRTQKHSAGEAQSNNEPPETVESLRKMRRKQAKIMAEVVRQKHRQILRQAKFCTLALDEWKGRKLVHFRCDYHEAPWYHQGTMGFFKTVAKTSEEGAEDHAKRAVIHMDELLTRFCTPLRKASLGTECDNELKVHILNITATLSADGGPAERRALYLASASGLLLKLKV